MTSLVLPDRLPGKEAHLKMAPESRVTSLLNEQAPPTTARESAVLVLLTPIDNPYHTNIGEWKILLIKRNIYHGIHSGQIAFPGGKCEPHDIDHHATACREAYEEMGIERNKIKIIGNLTELYVPPSNFTIYPTVAIDQGIQKLIPNPREVMEYMKVPLKYFNPAKSERYHVQTKPNEWVYAPGYKIDKNIIWGATAMIISELYQSVM